MKTKTISIIISTLVLLTGCTAATGLLQPATFVADENGQQASIILSNLVVEPVDQSGFCDIKNLEYGEDIIITVEAGNPGTEPEGRYITLYIDWKEQETRYITLGPGENTVIVFELMIDKHPDGMYQVAIDELWSSFGVG